MHRTILWLVAGLLSLPTLSAEPTTFLWVEGEQPVQSNFPPQEGGVGHPNLLSNGAWLHLGLVKEEVAGKLPQGGFQLRYDLTVATAGRYEVWARVGFEGVRAPVEWRVGEGDWATVAADVRTTNLMNLSLWTEVAWLRLGETDLAAGRTTLELRYREPGRDGRLLVGLDCLCLTLGRWVPDGRLKPGESYDSDQDRAAAPQVYRFDHAPAAPQRVELPLTGPWQVARYDDPDMAADAYAPVAALPSPDDVPLRWMGVDVPSSLWAKDETAYGHRAVYRTRVEVPANMGGRGFKLHFSGTTWIVSVFANGHLAGTHQGVLIPWDADLTRWIRAGEVNEIAVAVKGSWYAFDAKAMNQSGIQNLRNLPNDERWLRNARWVAPIYPSTKGEGSGVDYGLVNPVTLVVTGPVYVTDAFVRTSVANKHLDADVTVLNPGDQPRRLTVRCEALDDRSGQVAHAFDPVTLDVPAGSAATAQVGGDWPDPKLWWPVDDPDLYRLRTTLLDGEGPVDVQEQLFGFREVTVEGIHIRLNGVIRNFWNWVEVSGRPSTPEEWLRRYRAEGNRFYRFAADAVTRRWFPTREQRLEFYDRHGVPGRLSTCIDGMFINYDLRNPLVWENFNQHCAQAARAYRNHPSIMVYSLENELLYINGQNVFGGLMDQIEDHAAEMAAAARAEDPTRPYMVDGAGHLNGRLEVQCWHYPEAPSDAYPADAFTLDRIADHSSRWPWDRQHPVMMGETFFYAGKVENQAWIGGDKVFRGRDFADLAASRYVQLLIEGWRWQGVAGICPWVASSRVPGAERVFSSLAAFTRQREHRVEAGRPASIVTKVFNDTFDKAPVTFSWALEVDGKPVAQDKAELTIEPGTGQEHDITFTAPAAKQRVDSQLLLRVEQNGKVGYEQREPVTIFPPLPKLDLKPTVYVLDGSNQLQQWLAVHSVRSVDLASLAGLPKEPALVLVGPDSLTADDASSTALLACAARGGKVVVLEQEHPLAAAALPAPVRITPRNGGYAFAQALGTPLFAGLAERDLIDWDLAGPTYVRAYEKPSGGIRSLVECGEGLNSAALLEAPCGDGVILACQLRVGALLGREPAADRLLANLLTYAATYHPSAGRAAIVAATSPLTNAMTQAGVTQEAVANAVAALDPARFKVAVIRATKANLEALAAARAKLDAFTQAGGWVMLCGLEPDGLAAFDQLVGWQHLLRPFRVERVTLEAPGQALTATIGNRDLTFYDTRELMFGDYWLSPDVFSYVVDGADIAPFCHMPAGPDDPMSYQPTWDDHDPYNYVNGCFNVDSWRYIAQLWIDEDGMKPLTFGLPEPAELSEIRIWNNLNYWAIQDLDVIFDGDEAHARRIKLEPDPGVQTLHLDPPAKAQRSVTLQVRSWQGEPIIRDRRELHLVGIDNVQFVRAMPQEYAQRVLPIDSAGGLVAYPRGNGGLLLNQLKWLDEEPNPANGPRKVRLLATLLQNLGAGSASRTAAVPGVNVVCEPLDLTRWCNRYVVGREGQPGWFGERNRDLRGLPPGRQTFEGVEFHISDYATAPLPQSIMLAGDRSPERLRELPRQVAGIAVGKPADALFFLQACQVHRPIQDRERGRRDYRVPELLRYVIHYADGTAAEIPVRLGEELDTWLQAEPQALPGASIAWSRPLPDAKPDDPRAVLYLFRWSNPKPEVAVESIDVVAGANLERATPAVLAITVGRRIGGGE